MWLGIEKGAWELFLGPSVMPNSIVLQQVKIEELKMQIDLMGDQLSRKNDQISYLNEVTKKQAVHIQNLIQENSKLNTIFLP
jgi:hypothetical protein